MPSKKKSKKRSTAKPVKKVRLSIKAKAVTKPAKRKAAQKHPASRSRSRARKKPAINAETELRREFRRRNVKAAGITSSRRSLEFEGSSRVEQADSESVEELVEEGNLFEAGAVAGVEEADNADEREVQSRELLEDDVPEEYLDKE